MPKGKRTVLRRPSYPEFSEKETALILERPDRDRRRAIAQRSFYARIIPADKAAEFFGFYNMLGKFAAILGPAIMGSVALWSGNPRYGILAIIPLFVLGGVLLLRVRSAPVAP